MSKRYIIADVYLSDGGSCSNGGLSSKFKTVLFETPDGFFDESAIEKLGLPTVKAVEHSSIKDYFYAVPTELHDQGKWLMFGGAFIYSSDSRFPQSALKLHDRVE